MMEREREVSSPELSNFPKLEEHGERRALHPFTFGPARGILQFHILALKNLWQLRFWMEMLHIKYLMQYFQSPEDPLTMRVETEKFPYPCSIHIVRIVFSLLPSQPLSFSHCPTLTNPLHIHILKLRTAVLLEIDKKETHPLKHTARRGHWSWTSRREQDVSVPYRVTNSLGLPETEGFPKTQDL